MRDLWEVLIEDWFVTTVLVICMILLCACCVYQYKSWVGIPVAFIIVISGYSIGWFIMWIAEKLKGYHLPNLNEMANSAAKTFLNRLLK